MEEKNYTHEEGKIFLQNPETLCNYKKQIKRKATKMSNVTLKIS